ncbi:hypothetical protein HDU88_006979 [Geranomyces variabilis]|nr:hypothetical protein HDU88_006979 [Geranomyces variabilis]
MAANISGWKFQKWIDDDCREWAFAVVKEWRSQLGRRVELRNNQGQRRQADELKAVHASATAVLINGFVTFLLRDGADTIAILEVTNTE